MNILTLYFYPSSGINWSSPCTLALTSARGKLLRKSRFIGHVSVRLESDDPSLSFFTGMTQKNPLEGRFEVLFKGYGLGIFYHDFIGALEDEAALSKELDSKLEEGSVSFLRIQLNLSQAKRLKEYLETFQKLGCDRHYGLIHRPLYSEGGGCSAFAASCIEAAGIMEDELKAELLKHWTQTIRIPQYLIGGPNKPYVSFLKTLSTTRWADETEAHESLFFWDPDLMHQWVLTNSLQNLSSLKLKTVMLKKAKGLELDCSYLEAPPTSPFKVQKKSPRLHTS